MKNERTETCALAAMETARRLGADYADIRVQKTTEEHLSVRNGSIKGCRRYEISGYGVRIFKNGAWGFVHTADFSEAETERVVKEAFSLAQNSACGRQGDGLALAGEEPVRATHATPRSTDPFDIPQNRKLELLLECARTMQESDGVKIARASMMSRRDVKLFASLPGSWIESDGCLVEPVLEATAVSDDGDSESRSFDPGGRACGYEWIGELDLPAQAERIAREAVTKVNAGQLSGSAERTLILDPNNLSLTMHESIGHPTELDRALGWEADMAGTSFVTPEDRNRLRYGSDLVTFYGDNTLEAGLATGYDDDGVPGQKWAIVENGIFREYGTTRATAPLVGEPRSRGCNRATYYYDFPINRIPNLYLAPGERELSPEELIADTEDGVYIEGQGSFSIDQRRVNFQFGGDMFYEIKKGKIVRPLKKVIYRSSNPRFWSSVDAICDSRFFDTFGVVNCGKGQPMQVARMTHGASHARFRGINVGGA